MKIYKTFIAATLFLFIMCVEGISSAQTSSWSADVTHSNMGFKALHKGVAYTVGEFRDFDLSMKTSTDGFADAEIELTIDAASINTANSSRDNHLREYFETEQYPNITFKTNSIDQTDENMYTLKGVFTMHGVSKEIEVQMKHIGTTQSRGKEIAGLYFTATVNRMDYGVGLDLSSVAPEVQLHADIEIIKK
jgi:polyisoprenoid-binding protein YceI